MCRLKRLVAVIPLAAVALLPACGDLSEFVKPITPAEISGEWQATDFVVTNPANPTQSFNAIEEGFSLFLRFSIDGDFQAIIQYPDVPDAVDTGTYEIVDDFILVLPDVPPPDTVHFAYEFQSSKTSFSLSLVSDDWTWDFDGDGTDEPAFVFAIVIR